MKKIKILYVITGLTPGGAELTLKNFIINLNPRVFDISVCSITDTKDLVHLIKDKVRKIYFLGTNKFFESLKALIKLRKIIKEENPDILHCFMFHSNILGRFASMGCRCKVVSSIQTKLIGNKYGNFLDRISQRLVDSYMVNSRALFEFISNYGIKEKKIFLLENGVDFDRFKVKFPPASIKKALNLPDLPIITMVANFKKQKDYPTMIRALSYLQQDTEVYFLAVGCGLKFEDETERIEKLIRKLDLKNIKLMGFRDDIPEILSVTDIWVSSTLFEGQSNSLLEAMAMKKPIVTTNIPENLEVVRNGKEALLVPVKTPIELANNIKRLINNKKLSDTLASNAYNRVYKKYTLEKAFNKLNIFYKSLMNLHNYKS